MFTKKIRPASENFGQNEDKKLRPDLENIGQNKGKQNKTTSKK